MNIIDKRGHANLTILVVAFDGVGPAVDIHGPDMAKQPLMLMHTCISVFMRRSCSYLMSLSVYIYALMSFSHDFVQYLIEPCQILVGYLGALYEPCKHMYLCISNTLDSLVCYILWLHGVSFVFREFINFLVCFLFSCNQGCLPVQYEDFFVICFGRIDLRLAYHNNCQIWPVGYRSVWHDRITGSIFECEVSDGGDAGPVFKVRRHPCSALPIPIGQTVLLYNNANKCDASERTETNCVILESDLEKDDDIIMLLSDPSYSDLEQVSCFSSNLCGNSHGTSTQMEVDEPDGLTSHSEKFDDSSVRTSTLRDEIGDFYVEGRSSFSVWKMVSQTLVDSCREVFKQSGSLQFTCRHRNQISSSLADNGRSRLVDHLGTLARFCSSAGPTNFPQVIQNHTEFDLSCQLVAEWLNQDRFGLDMGFVKEVIETFPESHACSGYQFLANRADFSKSMTVASGVILAVQRNGDGGEDKVPSYGLYRRQMMLKQQDFAADHQSSDRQPPPGKPCSRRLPAELVGDVYQVSYSFRQLKKN